jgi:hypothetical protein
MLPRVLWIVVDPVVPIATHNRDTVGVYTSAAFAYMSADAEFRKRYEDGNVDYFYWRMNPERDCLAISPYELTVTAPYAVEHNAEVYRNQHHPLKPSRLSALFAFESKKDAMKAAVASGRGRENVVQGELLDHPLNRLHRGNMDIVTMMREALRVASLDQAFHEHVWGHYWSGSETPLEVDLPIARAPHRRRTTVSTTWEWLIDGQVRLVGHPRATVKSKFELKARTG